MPSEKPDDHAAPQPPPAHKSGATLEEILDRYLEELAAGEIPDQQAYVAAHPELADALRGVFKTLDFVEATSRSLNAAGLRRHEMLGEYRILREVGRGGMGVVYEAIQTSMGRRVALKVLAAGTLLSDTALERFTREAAMAGRLQHANIVPVYAVGQEHGIHFYAMQFVEGCTLAEHLAELRASGNQPGREHFRRVAGWGRQIADALAHAHERGVIHRDVKPSNLLRDARGSVWITDFGLARGDALSSLTISGDVVGTARYMSPEQARGSNTQLDERTDIYSLGATLYELLTLEPAFDGSERDVVLNQIAVGTPLPIRQLNRAIPRDLETIVSKCMEKDPDRRYPRAAAVAEDCRRFVEGEPIHARRTPLAVKAARFVAQRRWYTLAAVVVLALIVTTAMLTGRLREAKARQYLDEAFTAVLFKSDLERAGELLDNAESLGVGTPRLYLYRGLGPLLNGQPQRAIPPLLKAYQRDPEHVEVCYALSFAYYSTADISNGERFFEANVGRRIDTALGWLLRGLTQAKVQDAGALESYNRAIAMRVDFTPAISARAHHRGNLLLAQGDRTQLQPMLDDFDAWVVFAADTSRAYAARATGWLFAAAYATTQPDLSEFAPTWLENSRRDFVRTRELQRPHEIGGLNREGVYRRFVGEHAQATACFKQALEIDRQSTGKNHPGIVHQLAISLHAQGELEEALQHLTPACEDLPGFFPLPLQKALLLAELGRLEDARAVCRTCVAAQTGNPTGLIASAIFLELLGAPAEALAAVRELQARTARDARPTVAVEADVPNGLAYFLGEIDATAFLASTKGRPGARCEAAFIVALREISRGNQAAGREFLQTCLDTGVFIYIDYRFAQVFMARVQVAPLWPHWVAARESDQPHP